MTPGILNSISIFRIGNTSSNTTLVQRIPYTSKPIKPTSPTQQFNIPEEFETNSEFATWKGVHFQMNLTTVKSSWLTNGYMECVDIPLLNQLEHQIITFPIETPGPLTVPYWEWTSTAALNPSKYYANKLWKDDFTALTSYTLNKLTQEQHTFTLIKNREPTFIKIDENYKTVSQFSETEIPWDNLHDFNFSTKVIKLYVKGPHKLYFQSTVEAQYQPKTNSYLNHFAKRLH